MTKGELKGRRAKRLRAARGITFCIILIGLAWRVYASLTFALGNDEMGTIVHAGGWSIHELVSQTQTEPIAKDGWEKRYQFIKPGSTFVSTIVTILKEDNHITPLSFLIYRALKNVHDGDWRFLRLWSCLIFIASTYFFYQLACIVLQSKDIALFAVALFSLEPLNSTSEIQIRFYGLSFLLVTVSQLTYLKARSTNKYAPYFLSTLLALYNHLLVIPIVVLQILQSIYLYKKSLQSNAQMKKAVFFSLAALAFVTPWCLCLLYLPGRWTGGLKWLTHEGSKFKVLTSLPRVVVSHIWELEMYPIVIQKYIILCGIATILVALMCLRYIARESRLSITGNISAMFGAFFVIFLFLGYQGITSPRYFVEVRPFWILLCACPMYSLMHSSWRSVPGGISVFLLLLFSSLNVYATTVARSISSQWPWTDRFIERSQSDIDDFSGRFWVYTSPWGELLTLSWIGNVERDGVHYLSYLDNGVCPGVKPGMHLLLSYDEKARQRFENCFAQCRLVEGGEMPYRYYRCLV